MDFGYSQKVLDLQAKLRSFVAGLVLPNNERWHREVEAGSYPLEFVDELKAQAKASFLPKSRSRSSNTIQGNPPCAPSTPAPIENVEIIRATAWNLIATAKARSLLRRAN
jgi:hypothetical protein